jgi:hypothetical protein
MTALPPDPKIAHTPLYIQYSKQLEIRMRSLQKCRHGRKPRGNGTAQYSSRLEGTPQPRESSFSFSAQLNTCSAPDSAGSDAYDINTVYDDTERTHVAVALALQTTVAPADSTWGLIQKLSHPP